MSGVQVAVLLLVAIAATGVVFTRDAARQTVALSFYGVLLGLMFLLFRAPDVALSQIVVGVVVLPLIILLALAKARKDVEEAGR